MSCGVAWTRDSSSKSFSLFLCEGDQKAQKYFLGKSHEKKICLINDWN